MERGASCPSWSVRRDLIATILIVAITGCAEVDQLTTSPSPDAPPSVSPSAPPASPVAQPSSPAGGPQAGPPAAAAAAAAAAASEPTPEAAQILKEHGYDVSQGKTSKEVEALEGPMKSGGDTTPPQDFDPFAPKDQVEVEEYDPWEKFNIYAFEFNYKFDKYLLKPVAKGYNFIMPDSLQLGIANFFQNIRWVPRMLNNVFQAKFKGAGIETSRFLINSTLGIGGLFDPAKNWFNLETPVEDTGQTFGHYGMKPGPYIVVPFIGSFTLRDGVGYIADIFLDPFNWFVLPIIKLNGAPKVVAHEETITWLQLGMRAGIILNDRSLNLEKFQGVEESTLDLYAAVRNAYLQQRARLIRE